MRPPRYPSRWSQRTHRLNVATALLTVELALLLPGSARASDAPGKDMTVSVGAPTGFGDLARSQRSVADIYFGDRRLGQAEIDYELGRLTFLDVDAVVTMLSEVLDPAAVRQALDGALDTHAEVVCTISSDRQVCGRLHPAVAGIIFDQDRFRVALFVNAKYLKVRAATDETFLPRPTAALSLVDQVAGTIAGGSGGTTTYAVQNRAVLGVRDARIISTTSFASVGGLRGDVLSAQIDKPGMRYSAGAFWAPGIDLIGRRKMLGVGIETQFDTRSDKDLLNGSPLVVSLSQRSRVDILVDNRLLGSRTYEAGNQSLDTSGLPEGVYEVVLHIQEVGGANRDERRFFTKNPRIAPVGKALWFARGGVLMDDTQARFLAPTRKPYVEAGIARRLSQHIALDATIVGTSGTAIAELGSYLITPVAQLRLAVLGSNLRDYGALFQASSSGTSRITYNVDLRRIHSHDNQPLVPINTLGSLVIASRVGGSQTVQLAAGSFTQLLGDIGFRLKRGQLGVSAFYRKDVGQQKSYAVGPTGRWSVFEHHGLDLTVEANISQSNYGRSAYAGLRLQLLRPHSSFGITAGAQTVASSGQGNRSSVVGGVQGTWQDEDILGGTLVVAGNLDHTPDTDLAHARADIRGPLGTVAADVIQQVGGNGATQYSLGLQTAAVVNRSMFVLGGKDQSDSVIAVRVKDASPQASFQVLVDETPRGVLHVGETLPIAVTPYRQYHVRIRPLGGELVHFDTSAKQVSVYPGNVASLAWSVKPVVAMFGQVLWPDGSPIRDADLLAEDAIGHTDHDGYFQIETSLNVKLQVRTIDGRSCTAVLNGAVNEAGLNGKESTNGYVALGAIGCQDVRPFGPPAVIAAR